MPRFQADLHIHTVLSPCGDLDMSPERIVDQALSVGLDLIAITDHNSTRQCALVMEIGQEKGLMVLPGVELNSREEAHVLALFPDLNVTEQFQEFIDRHLPAIPNDPDYFGYQVVVNRKEEIVYQEERSLISALDVSLEDLAKKVKEMGGLFIPSHVDRPRFSVLSQLGIWPMGLEVDALEWSDMVKRALLIRQQPILENFTPIRSSDAHFLERIGAQWIILEVETLTFEELKLALKGQKGRRVLLK